MKLTYSTLGHRPHSHATKVHGGWLLAVALLGLVLQSTILPIVDATMAMRTLNHMHFTSSGIVPPHSHPWDRANGGAGAQSRHEVCAVTGSDSALSKEGVTCAPDRTGSASYDSSILPSTVTELPLSTGVEVGSGQSAAVVYTSVVAPVPLPPPLG